MVLATHQQCCEETGSNGNAERLQRIVPHLGADLLLGPRIVVGEIGNDLFAVQHEPPVTGGMADLLLAHPDAGHGADIGAYAQVDLMAGIN